MPKKNDHVNLKFSVSGFGVRYFNVLSIRPCNGDEDKLAIREIRERLVKIFKVLFGLIIFVLAQLKVCKSVSITGYLNLWYIHDHEFSFFIHLTLVLLNSDE